MPEGTVKFFNRAKGFGFIIPDDGGKEIFLPPAAAGEAGTKLAQGQRVSFEVVADPKGPKAAALKILEEVRVVPRAAPPPPAASLYCDPETDAAQDVLAALEALGRAVQPVDITVAPPTVPQLKMWSQMLAGSGQGLVRRTAPLFFDLQLDDRFLTEDEFWTAVVQHPRLISGPILATRDRVRICRTEGEVKAFFSASGGEAVAAGKPVSSRLMAMMRGEAVQPRPQPAPPEPARAKAAPKPAKPPEKKTAAPAKVAPKTKKAPEKPAAKKAIKAKPPKGKK